MKKGLSVILSLLTIILLFSGCKGDGADVRLTFPLNSQPKYLDPQIVTDPGGIYIVQNCYEGLLTYGENGELVNAGCDSFEVSESGLTYTFNLKQDAKWKMSSYAKKTFEESELQDFDMRVTAHDYVFAFQRVVSKETNSPYYSALLPIKNASAVHKGKLSTDRLGVFAEDDYTLKIKLENKNDDFIYTLCEVFTKPCNEEFFKRTGGRYCLKPESTLSNGAFYMTNIADGTAITCYKNSDFHNAANVMPSLIYFSINNKKETRGEKLKSGSYTVAPLEKSIAEKLESGKKVSITTIDNGVFCLSMNCKNSALQNELLRKALAFSFDSSVFLNGTARREAQGILPQSCTVFGKSYREQVGSIKPNYDTAASAKYFENALSALEQSQIELKVLCGEDDELTVRKALQNWQASFGAKCNFIVEAVGANVLEQRLNDGDYQLAFCNLFINSPTAFSALNSFGNNGLKNYPSFKSKTVEKTLSNAQRAKSNEEYCNLLKSAEQFIYDSAAILPIYENESYFGTAKGVSGVITAPGGKFILFDKVLNNIH